MLDTLKTVKKFQQIYNWSKFCSGYIQVGHFDYGPIFSSFGFNEVEGVRLRTGGRTYFGPNDTCAFRAMLLTVLMTINLNTDFLVSGWSIRKKRIILSGGRRDIEQIGASLTTTNDVLGGVLLHHPFFSSGSNA
jgi:hypothetical protein